MMKREFQEEEEEEEEEEVVDYSNNKNNNNKNKKRAFGDDSFVSCNFGEAKEVIRNDSNFKMITPFRVRLSRFAVNSGSKYLYLEPEFINSNSTTNDTTKNKKKGNSKKSLDQASQSLDPLTTIHNILVKLFPTCQNTEQTKDYHPHLSVGQISQTEMTMIAEQLQNDWIPIEFDVNEIYIMHRKSEDSMMKIAEVIELYNK